jgi:hypothetical protein
MLVVPVYKDDTVIPMACKVGTTVYGTPLILLGGELLREL